MTEIANSIYAQFGLVGLAVIGLAYLMKELVQGRLRYEERLSKAYEEHRDEMREVHATHRAEIRELITDFRADLAETQTQFFDGLASVTKGMESVAGEVRDLRLRLEKQDVEARNRPH